MVALVEQLSLADLVILVAVLGFAADRIADWKGWSRSSKTLRRENEDLVRRNGELEQTVSRHEAEIRRLESKVGELERTNQAAVLTKLEEHERNAGVRNDRTLSVLTEILDTLKTGARP